MSKELPKVFVNQINKQLRNNSSIYYSFLENKNNSSKTEKHKTRRNYMQIVEENTEPLVEENIKSKINKLFDSQNFVYKLDVIITMNDKEIEKQIIAMANDNLLTIEGEKIKISDIKDIKEKTT